MSWSHERAFNILSSTGAIVTSDVKYGRGFEVNGVKVLVAKNPGGKVVIYINEKSATGENVSTILPNSEYGNMQDFYPKEGDKKPRGSAKRSLKKDESIYSFNFEREAEFNKLLNWYIRGAVPSQKLVEPLIKSKPEPDNKETSGYKVDNSRDDQRKKVLSNTATRPGQLTFRRELVNLEKGTICSVTECSVGQVVQAAHIMPYLSETDNHPENGILMRSDIHILFDRYLLGIHPQTLKISLAPQIIESQNYYSLHGIKLKNNHKLSASALEKRWQWFLSKNSDAYIKA